MTLMRDVAVVSDRARFRVPELLRGVADCYLGARLARRVGVGRAKWPLFSESRFAALGRRLPLLIALASCERTFI